MKKIIMSTVAALAIGITANAYPIIIEISGTGVVTSEPNGGYSVSCLGTTGCCATIIINCSVQQTPTQGDLTIVRECDGTSFQNINHQWQGSYLSSSVTTDQTGTYGTVTLYNDWQDF